MREQGCVGGGGRAEEGEGKLRSSFHHTTLICRTLGRPFHLSCKVGITVNGGSFYKAK